MRFDKNCGRVGTARTWTARLTFASLTLATALAWVAPASARIGIAPETRRYCDENGNVAFTAPRIDWKATAATAKDGGKPERVVWSDGSYPYALLSEKDRAYVDAELADFAEEEAEKAEERKRLEFYDADGSIAFEGVIDCEATAATAKDGGKPELVVWYRTRERAKSLNEKSYVGSYPYARLSEEDRAFVDAELAEFAKKTTEEAERRKRIEFYDANGNFAFEGWILCERTLATVKEGAEKPERVLWREARGGIFVHPKGENEPAPDGSYPYALLSEEDRAFVDAELAKYAEEAPKRAEQEKIDAERSARSEEEYAERRAQYKEERKDIEFYDANGNLVFTGEVNGEATWATVKEGAEKPERVFWSRESQDGSYPYALLSEEDRAFVDAKLTKFAKEAAKRAEKEAEKKRRLEFYDADGNLVFTGVIGCEATLATVKEGAEKPERILWKDGSYPYALLSEEDRAFVDAELTKFAEQKAKRAKEEAERKSRLEFYDADGNLVFTGVIDCEATSATVKEGAEKPERVLWKNGSYPYALLSEEDRAFVDAELTKFAEQKAAFGNVKKAAAEAKANWEKEAPQTPEVKRVEGRKIAILFGCDQFEDENIGNLQYAASDVKFLAERLTERGFDSKNVLVLTEEKATRAMVYRTLEIIAKVTKPGDMIFVAFNGQGVEIDGEIYWVPTDANVDDLTGTCVALSDFTAKLDAAAPGREKALFFDACREIPNDLMKNEQKTDANPAEAKPRSGMENVWTLYACESGGLAYEGGASRHGVFTYSFAEGLTKEGDANGDGVVTLMEAFFYAKAKTTTTAEQDFKVEQTPVAVGPFADLEMVDLNAAPQKTQNGK